jgi:FKBP-type peptidyl-prolyl cis-trans isomerase
LQYKVISQGKGKATPSLSDRVLISFHLTRIDNSNLTDGGAGKIERESQISKLPKGLQEALQLMTEGDYWQLFIPPGLH